MKVGDILTYAYSYNARYPQFVRVTRTTAKSVWLEKLEKTWAANDGYGQNGTRVPALDRPARPMSGSFRIKSCSYWPEYIKVDGCICTPWDGNPEDEYTD